MKFSSMLALMLMSGVANAVSFTGEAVVVGVEPNYETRQVPRQKCEMARVPVQVTYPGQVVSRKTDTGRLILNTAIGAAIGNQFGKGKGNDAATIVGGLIGYGSTDSDVRYSGSKTVTEYRDIEQCKTVYETQRVQNGYNVQYNFNGFIGTKFSSTYPGTTIDVSVTIGE